MPKRGSSSAVVATVGPPSGRSSRSASAASSLHSRPYSSSESLTSAGRTTGRMSTSTCFGTPSAVKPSGIVRSQPAPNS